MPLLLKVKGICSDQDVRPFRRRENAASVVDSSKTGAVGPDALQEACSTFVLSGSERLAVSDLIMNAQDFLTNKKFLSLPSANLKSANTAIAKQLGQEFGCARLALG